MSSFKLYLALFALLVPAVLTIGFPNVSGSSKIENRSLQDMPEFPRNYPEVYSWPQRFDQFVVDRFPYREQLIRFIGKRLYQLGFSISPEVMIGRDGWLFIGDRAGRILDKQRGLLLYTPEELDLWVEEYLRRQSVLAEKGITLLFAVVPNKHTIYPEYLKPWDQPVGPSRVDQLVAELDRRNIEGIIDLRSPLKQRARSETIFNKYDTHWNDLGAYYAYQEIIQRVPGARAVNRDKLTFYDSTSGELSNLIGYPELQDKTIVLDQEVSDIAFKHDMKPGDGRYMRGGWTSETLTSSLPRALFYVDSFTDSFMYKYLAPSFRQALFKHHEKMQFEPGLIEKFEPDYVIYIVVERGVPGKLR